MTTTAHRRPRRLPANSTTVPRASTVFRVASALARLLQHSGFAINVIDTLIDAEIIPQTLSVPYRVSRITIPIIISIAHYRQYLRSRNNKKGKIAYLSSLN